jgi:hypothetical protein
MSTCPNEELFCAFVDDEVPLILKEKLEEHLLQCEKCRQIINRYKFLKTSIAYNETPVLDLDKSFEKLLLKRKSTEKKYYDIFPIRLRYKVVASVVAGMFLFAFLFVLLKHNSAYDKVYTLNKKSVQFKPIVPMPYRQHSNVITHIDLRGMTSVIKTNKKSNAKIYKNFTNTFNNFTCLYAPLENHKDNFTVSMPSVNENLPYNYGIKMPVYVNLNKNAK